MELEVDTHAPAGREKLYTLSDTKIEVLLQFEKQKLKE
jgi:hypothetical protein